MIRFCLLCLLNSVVLAKGIKYPWLTQNFNRQDGKLPGEFNSYNDESVLSNLINDDFDDTATEKPTLNYPFAMMKYWAMLNPDLHHPSPSAKRNLFLVPNGLPDPLALFNNEYAREYVELGEPEYRPELPNFDRSVLEKQKLAKTTSSPVNRK